MGEDRETLRQFLRLIKCEDAIETDGATVEIRFPLSVRVGLPSEDRVESHPIPDAHQHHLCSEYKESSFPENVRVLPQAA